MEDWVIHEGDCLEVMHTIPSGSVDMILCDLPYGTTQATWDSVIPLGPLWTHYKRVIRQGGAIVLFGAQPFTTLLIASNLPMFRYTWVWDKVNRITGFLDVTRRPLKVTEDICVFYSEQPTYNPQMVLGAPYKTRHGAGTKLYGTQRKTDYVSNGWRYPQNIIRIPGDERGTVGRIHPTQKPVALLEYLVRTYTNASDLVLDNACGSGSTGEACIRTDRHFIGIESKSEYVAIARARLARVAAEPRQATMELSA